MAFGIDDALMTAAAAIGLTDTIVQTIKRYEREKKAYDLELLIEEVRITALRRIDEADLALAQFERTLVQRGIDPNRRLADVIAETSILRPFEQHRLSQFQKQFNYFSDCVYSAGDDIAALVRCSDQTRPMGVAVVESSKAKHDLHAKLINAGSLKEAIDLLRTQLAKHKAALSGGSTS